MLACVKKNTSIDFYVLNTIKCWKYGIMMPILSFCVQVPTHLPTAPTHQPTHVSGAHNSNMNDSVILL